MKTYAIRQAYRKAGAPTIPKAFLLVRLHV